MEELKMIVVVRCNNGIVTDKYLDIVSDAIKGASNKKIEYVNNISEVKKYDKI